MTETLKICILVPYVREALDGKIRGGKEKQTALIAQEFAKRKHQVYVLDDKMPYRNGPSSFNGITFINPWDPNYSYSGLRSLYRLRALIKTINSIGPNVIYGRGTDFYPSLVSFYYRKKKTVFLWGLAAEKDLKPAMGYREYLEPNFYDFINHKLLFTLAAKLLAKYSDLIVCQTTEQQSILNRKQSNHILASNIIKSNDIRNTQKKSDLRLIWVGKLIGHKGEFELLKLAQLIENHIIYVVGHVDAQFQSTKPYKEILKQKNLKFLGRLTALDLQKYYQSADIFISTSPSEGFSNTFLEAWSFKLPVISLNVNPNGLLNNEYLGHCSNGSIKDMAAKITQYSKEPSKINEIGKRAYDYVTSNHSPEVIIDKLESELQKRIT